MACLFNTLLAGWISPAEHERHVESTYGNAFHKVTVERRLSNGEWDQGVVRLEDGSSIQKKNRYEYLQNVHSGEFFFPDSPQLVAFKCFEIAVVAPLYTLVRMVFHLCRIVYLIGKIVYESIASFVDAMKRGEDSCRAFVDHVLADCPLRILTEAVGLQLWEVIKAPYFGLGLFIAACEGFMHDPYKAKTEIALIERHWNDGKTRHHDWRVQEVIHHGCFQGILNADAFFLAFCMQPIGSCEQFVVSSDNRTLEKYKIVKRDEDPLVTGCLFPPCISTAC